MSETGFKERTFPPLILSTVHDDDMQRVTPDYKYADEDKLDDDILTILAKKREEERLSSPLPEKPDPPTSKFIRYSSAAVAVAIFVLLGTLSALSDRRAINKEKRNAPQNQNNAKDNGAQQPPGLGAKDLQ